MKWECRASAGFNLSEVCGLVVKHVLLVVNNTALTTRRQTTDRFDSTAIVLKAHSHMAPRDMHVWQTHAQIGLGV
jgi:hypothetical protein